MSHHKNNYDHPTFSGDIQYGLPISPGTHQEERLPAPLQANWFHIEERSPATLLSMSRQYAAKLRYFSRQNQDRGEWKALFQHDEAAVMAEMFSPEAILEDVDFFRHLKESRAAAAQDVLKIAHKLDHWLGRLRSIDNEEVSQLLEQINKRAGHLAGSLDQILLIANGKNASSTNESREQSQGSYQNLRCMTERDNSSSQTLHCSLHHHDTKEFLLTTYASFHQTLLSLLEVAPLFWKNSLQNGKHEPAIGLFIAFLQLYYKAMGTGRSFPERHLDFYYQEVLRTGPQQLRPDSLHLVMRTLPSGEALVQQGDRFSAGTTGPNGEEKIYLADHGLRVTNTKVERLQTLSFNRHNLISPAWEMGCFTHCWTNELTVAAEPEPGTEPAHLPLFGDAQHLVRRYGAKEAQLGLALAAPELLLSQGRREIELTLCYKAAEEVEAQEVTDQEVEAQEERGAAEPKTVVEKLMKKMEKAPRQEDFFLHFGRFIAFHLSPTDQEISEEHRERIEAAARIIGIPQPSIDLITQLLEESDQGNLLFYRFPDLVKKAANFNWRQCKINTIR